MERFKLWIWKFQFESFLDSLKEIVSVWKIIMSYIDSDDEKKAEEDSAPEVATDDELEEEPEELPDKDGLSLNCYKIKKK